MVLALLFCTVVLFGQTQQGYVKTKGRLGNNGTLIAGTRLSGATITVRGGNAVTSGNNGAFSLSVPNSSYFLQNVQKQGYVLTDPDVLSKQYAYSKNPLVLVLETPDEQLEDKLETMEKIRATLQSQLAKSRAQIKSLKEQNKITSEEYQKKLQDLVKVQESNENLISEMAERYSKMDFDEVDEFNRRISDCIINGRLTEADSLLNTKGDINSRAIQLRKHQEANLQAERELTKKQKMLEKSKTMTKKELESLAQDCYTKFEIFKMQHMNDSAAHYVEFRASLDSTNVEWLQDAGVYAYSYLADYKKAQALFQKALRIAKRVGRESGMYVISLCNHLSETYREMAQNNEALKYCQMAIDTQRDLYGDDSPLMAVSLSNMGLVYDAMVRHDEAERCYLESLNNSVSIEDSIMAYINLAGFYGEIDKYDLALEGYGCALEYIRQVQDSENTPWAALCHNGMGSVFSYMDNNSQALDHYNQALAINLALYGENHPDVALVYNNMGLLYNKLGKYSEAQGYFQKDFAISSVVYGEWHPRLAVVYSNLGHTYLNMGKYDEALQNYQKAFNIDKDFYGLRHSTTASRLVNIGSVYDEGLKDYDKALEYFLQGAEILKEILGEQHHKVSTCYSNIGSVYIEMEEYDKAEEYLQRSLDIDLVVSGPNHSYTAATYNNLGRLFNHKGDYAKAAFYMEKCLPILQELYGEEHPNVAVTYYNIGVLYKKNGDYAEALNLTEKAYTILSGMVPEGHPTLKQFQDGINELKEEIKTESGKK